MCYLSCIILLNFLSLSQIFKQQEMAYKHLVSLETPKGMATSDQEPLMAVMSWNRSSPVRAHTCLLATVLTCPASCHCISFLAHAGLWVWEIVNIVSRGKAKVTGWWSISQREDDTWEVACLQISQVCPISKGSLDRFRASPEGWRNQLKCAVGREAEPGST